MVDFHSQDGAETSSASTNSEASAPGIEFADANPTLSGDPKHFDQKITLFPLFQKALISRLSDLEYKIWLSDLELQIFDDKLFFHSTSQFKQEKITERYWGLLKKLASEYFPGLKIDWASPSTTSSITSIKESESTTSHHPYPQKSSVSSKPNQLVKKEISSTPENELGHGSDENTFIPASPRILPENNWDNFLQLSENKLAHRFIFQALDRPGIINPIYIYGSVGVGKTHLLHAFALAYRERVPFARVEYLTPDDFVSDFTRALKSKTDRNFRIYYRSLDALLIDDIQFFMGKEKSSQEFFHVFNAIHASGKQMIFTSDRDPRELEHLDDRLKSRIASSAIIEIKPPGKESRKALIDFYATREGLNLTEEVKIFLSDYLPEDIRQLVGAIRYLSALHSFKEEEPLTSEFCQRYLKQLQVRPTQKKYPPEKILYAICSRFGFTLKDLKAKKKSKQISHCRQTAMYLLRQYTDLSLPEIGFALGGRSVSSVTHGIEKIENALTSSQGGGLKKELEGLIDKTSSTSVF